MLCEVGVPFDICMYVYGIMFNNDNGSACKRDEYSPFLKDGSSKDKPKEKKVPYVEFILVFAIIAFSVVFLLLFSIRSRYMMMMAMTA